MPTALNALTTLTAVSAVGAAAVGGVFYAFSTFVMPGLRRLPPAQGVAAMQQVNITAVRPGLMLALFGTAAVCAVTVGAGLLVRGADRRTLLLTAGALCYLIGAVGVTAGFNVPLNDALAGLDPTAADTAAVWRDYLQRWTAGNHVRTALCLAGAALLTAALVGTDT